eukprot:TRINITY_DN1584_c0_g1_i9.p1 TRINITY_DN1584_c0_g1~~TRINITY_DN1584_c0_g1_i9.p1  ORF type:complete len:496 (+),score=111.14 TRINITY_DN1584_c0_g1_i9:138-1625(+)
MCIRDRVSTQSTWANKLLELKSELDSKMQKEFESKSSINKIKSDQQANSYLSKFFNGVNAQISSTDAVKNTLLKEKLEEYTRFSMQYFKHAKGPKKYKVFAQKIPPFIYKFFDLLFQNIIQIQSEEHEQTKLYLQQAREGEASLRNQLKQYDELIFEHEKTEEQLKRTMEIQKREHEKNMKLKNYAEECLKAKVEELEKALNEKNKKLTKQKSKENTVADEIAALKSELNAKRIEISSLQKKVSEYDKFLDEQSGINSDYSPQLFKILKDLKLQVNDLEEFAKRRNEGSLNQNHLKEWQELSTKKTNEIIELQKKEKIKRQELQQNYVKNFDSQKRMISLLNQENSELKCTLIEQKTQKDQTTKTTLDFTQLQQQTNQLQDLLSHRQSNLETHQLIIEQYSNEISRSANAIVDLEQKFAIVHAQKISLEAFKETFPYVLKETLKWVANKQNKLKHAVKCLTEEDQNEVKEIIKACLLYTSPSPRDRQKSRMPSSA